MKFFTPEPNVLERVVVAFEDNKYVRH